MKNLAKVLALVLALTMVMSTFAFASNPFDDVDDNATYAEAVTMLKDLGILDGYEEDGGIYFKPDQTITRAEVAKIIVCALGAEEAASGTANLNKFTDVPASHWAAGYVNYIQGYNSIVAGYGNGKFGPSDEVLYEQIIKMVVCTVGYYPMAMQRGGYPTGFLAVASELGLTKGASGSAGQPAKRSVVARIVYNALTVPMMKQTGWDINNPEYTVTGTGNYKEETLLVDYLDVKKINGIVTNTFFQDDTVDKDNLKVTISDLSKDDAIAVNDDEDETSIDINIGNTEAQNYHGYAVTAYVYTDEDSEEQKLLAIAPRGTRNTVTVVDLDNIDEMSEKDVNLSKEYATISYEDANGKDATVKVSLNAAFYVNLDEKEWDVTEDADKKDFADWINGLTDKNGTITFVQNETTDAYADYMFVEYFSGNEYVITEINDNRSKVSYQYQKDNLNKRTGSEGLDAENEDEWVFFYKNGKSISFKDLEVGNVISKITNSAKTVKKVYVSDESVEGKISSVSEKKENVTVASTKYDYANSIFTTGAIGKTGVAYLNVNGKVVYFEETEGSTSNDDYALFFSAAQDEDKWGTNTVVSIRVLNANGKWNEYDLSDKLTVKYGNGDGEKFTKIDDFLDQCATVTKNLISFDADDKFDGKDPSVIQYKLNSSGKVSTLIIPKDGIKEDYLSSAELENVKYNEEDATLGKLDVADNAVIFTFNGDRDDQDEVRDEENYKVAKASGVFVDEDKYSGTYYVSKDGNEDEPNCFFLDIENNRAKVKTRLMVVTESGELENKDGDSQPALTGYINGNEDEETFFIDDDNCEISYRDFADYTGLKKNINIDYDQLAEGDVVAVSFNGEDEISDIVVVAFAEDVKAGIVRSDADNDNVDDGYLNVIAKNKNEKEVEFHYGYVADSATSKAGVTYFDLSNVFVETDNFTLKDVEMVGGRVRANKLIGNVYYVDLSKRNLVVTVGKDFEDVLANNINLKNGATVKGGEGYFMYAQSFDGDIVDAVVFIVDCETLVGEE